MSSKNNSNGWFRIGDTFINDIESIKHAMNEILNAGEIDYDLLCKLLLAKYIESAKDYKKQSIITDVEIFKENLYLSTLASKCCYEKGRFVTTEKSFPHLESENIDNLIEEFLENGFDGSGNKVAFIEGGPGSGKTMFSQKFAFTNALKSQVLIDILDLKKIQKSIDFLPVYIRLRDWTKDYLTKPEELIYKSFFTFIPNAISPKKRKLYEEATFSLTEENLLWDKKLLFIFDGLDELELQEEQQSNNFIYKILEFIEYYSSSQQNQNFLAIITGRPFQNTIKKELSEKIDWYYLDGFKIYKNEQGKEIDKKDEWTKNWDGCNNISIKYKNSFKNFITNLKNSEIYKNNKEIQNIFSEPFILFNVAKLVLENKLKVENLQFNEGYVRILIYEKIIFETIRKSREADKYNDLFEGRIDLKYEFIQKLATGIFNTDGEKAKIGIIKNRISKSLKLILKKITHPKAKTEKEKHSLIEKNLTQINDDNLLSFFYFKHNPNPDDFWDSNMEFAHKSFGEFLQAREIWQTLFDLKTEILNKFKINNPELDWRNILEIEKIDKNKFLEIQSFIYQILYNLLSGRAMTEQTIVYYFWRQMLEVATEDITKDGGFFVGENGESNPNNIHQFYNQFLTTDYQFIFEALESFYRKWSDREFINELPTKNLISKYQKNVSEFYKDQDLESLKTLRVDITTGVNVLLILLELHRKKIFLEKESVNYFEKLKNIPILELGKDSSFKQNWKYIEVLESGHNTGYLKTLENAYNTNYLGKFLQFADLSSAYLNKIDLRGVDISNGNLSSANLNYTDLSKAYLNYTDLNKTELKNTNLSFTHFNEANLNLANLSNSDLSYSYFYSSNLHNAHLYSVNLLESDFLFANLKGASLFDLRDRDFLVRNFETIKTWTKEEGNETNNPWGISTNLDISLLPDEARKMCEEWNSRVDDINTEELY
jgi:hypothetical protein